MVLIGINSVIDGLQITVIRDEVRSKNGEPVKEDKEEPKYVDKEEAKQGQE